MLCYPSRLRLVSSPASRLVSSRLFSCVCSSCLSISCYPSRLRLVSSRLRLSRLVCVCLVCLCVMCNSSGSIVYLPIHSNALKSISLKRLISSTCLTGFEVMGSDGKFSECSECLRGFEGINRFNSNNPLGKSHNSFSCPYRLLDYMNRRL